MNKALKIPVKSLESAFCDFYGYLGTMKNTADPDPIGYDHRSRGCDP